MEAAEIEKNFVVGSVERDGKGITRFVILKYRVFVLQKIHIFVQMFDSST